MSDNYVQHAINNGTGSIDVALTGVTAGNALVLFAMGGTADYQASEPVITDTNGTWPAASGYKLWITVDSNSVSCKIYVLENAAAGNHTVSVYINNGSQFAMLVEVGTTSNPSYLDAQGAKYLAPGTGADAISSGSVAAAVAATLIGLAVDSNNVGDGYAPTNNGGATSRAVGSNGAIGSWRLTSRAVSSGTAETFTATAGNGADTYQAYGITIRNSGGGGGGGFKSAFAVPNQTLQ